MSYLDRLMAQTGIGPAPAAAAPAEPIRAILEVEVEQAAAPVTPAQAEQPTRAAPPAPPAAAMPRQDARAEPGARTRQGTAEPAVRAVASPPSPPVPGATATEPSIAEIVIEQRPAGAIAPPLQGGAAPQERDEPRPQERQPDAVPKRPTFLDIRDWVAMTPAHDETPGPADLAWPAARSADMPPEGTAVTPDAAPAPAPAPAPHVAPARVLPLEESHVELSIGTVQVVVEAPAASVEPARAQPPAAAQADAPGPSWSRFSRRYIRP